MLGARPPSPRGTHWRSSIWAIKMVAVEQVQRRYWLLQARLSLLSRSVLTFAWRWSRCWWVSDSEMPLWNFRIYLYFLQDIHATMYVAPCHNRKDFNMNGDILH